METRPLQWGACGRPSRNGRPSSLVPFRMCIAGRRPNHCAVLASIAWLGRSLERLAIGFIKRPSCTRSVDGSSSEKSSPQSRHGYEPQEWKWIQAHCIRLDARLEHARMLRFTFCNKPRTFVENLPVACVHQRDIDVSLSVGHANSGYQ